ncbi:MAG: hypothetical protein LBC27_03765, partial [Spirochaetaceae bacterium]|nr:hypothetical protein [Spirochaetaceae bacterium]
IPFLQTSRRSRFLDPRRIFLYSGLTHSHPVTVLFVMRTDRRLTGGSDIYYNSGVYACYFLK